MKLKKKLIRKKRKHSERNIKMKARESKEKGDANYNRKSNNENAKKKYEKK